MPATSVPEITSVLEGTSTTPYLIAAWQHFVGEEYDPVRFARATVDFTRRWDWDWVKINPRAVYYSEAWGAQYDEEDYSGVVPKLLKPAISSVADLATITALDPANNAVFAEHITSAGLIREQLGDRPLVQTIFSPLSVLLQLAGLPLYPSQVIYGAPAGIDFVTLLTADPAATQAALAAIAKTLADYVRLLLAPVTEGGAALDGIFYAVTGTANEGFLSKAQFDEFSRPYDLTVLEAAADRLRVFHTCRAGSHVDWFADYPVSAVQWDQFLPGNPTISDEVGHPPIGGVSYSLFEPGSDPAEVSRQLAATVEARQGRPFLLAPSCTIPTPADDDLLALLRPAH